MSRPKIDVGKFREEWVATRDIQKSVIAAGGSPNTAARGYTALNKRCKAIVDGKEVRPASDHEIEALKEKLQTAEDVGEYIKEKIIRAIERGESTKNLESLLKLLGTFKEHNIFDAKKSNEVFVIAPAAGTFDQLDEWDIQPILEISGNQIILKPSQFNKGAFVDSLGNEYRVRVIGPQTNAQLAN